jgi:hypothetical protein
MSKTNELKDIISLAKQRGFTRTPIIAGKD